MLTQTTSATILPSNKLLAKICSIETRLYSMEIEGLVNLAEATDLDLFTLNDIHKTYFDWSSLKKLSLSKGVVATPHYIANYMVSESFDFLKEKQKMISWYDPCCGSGIFIESILKKYLDYFGESFKCNLPIITACEISPIGIFLTLLVIKKILNNQNIDLKSFVSSRKLQIYSGNALTSYIENKSLFDDTQSQFDIVIANPPYVRASRIPKKEKELLKQNFPKTYSGNADLYFYFIASCIESLKSDGVLNFISPANFFRTKSGQPLRELIYNTTNLIQLIDLDELKVFKNADIHTAIYWLKKRKSSSRNKVFKYNHFKTQSELDQLRKFNVHWTNKLSIGITGKNWKFLTSEKDYELNNSSRLVSLKDAGFKIYSGIRPGYKKAFIYHEKDISYLNKDIRSNWFLPSMEGRDLSKWKSKESGKFLLFTPKGTSDLPKEIISLLEKHKDKLTLRHDTKEKSSWYTLRSCSYYEIFKKERIVFPDISSSCKFSLENTYSINLDGSFIIDSNNLALLGILNSKIAWKYYLNHCSSLGNAANNGRLRFKKNHIEEIPIPRTLLEGSSTVSELEHVVKKIIASGESESLNNKLNTLVENLYSEHK